MHIEELTREDSLRFLAGHHIGRLACVRDAQPYITPFSYIYHEHFIYSFATVGKKVEWLRANPLACVEVDEIASPLQWTSIIASAKYEELTDMPARGLAYNLLQQQALWWEPGFVKTIVHGETRPMVPVYFRLSLEEITGHRAGESKTAN
jgi:uncharacterized protein